MQVDGRDKEKLIQMDERKEPEMFIVYLAGRICGVFFRTITIVRIDKVYRQSEKTSYHDKLQGGGTRIVEEV